jgi:hypothetical protein
MKQFKLVFALAGMMVVNPTFGQNSNTAGTSGMMAQDHGPSMPDCPMKLEGTTVSVADTPDGIKVTFTAKSENVAILQNRVERMATMHTMMSTSEGMQSHMIAGSAKYEALGSGAALTLVPNDSKMLEKFRAQVRTRVDQMKKGDCSMMQDMMMNGMMGNMPKAK